MTIYDPPGRYSKEWSGSMYLFTKTCTSRGATAVNLCPNSMKKIFCYPPNVDVYKDNRFIALRQILLFAQKFFEKSRHVCRTLK